MPRVKILEQPEYMFRFKLQVRISDINYVNHVGNSEMVDIIHEARCQIFKSLDLLETDLGSDKTSVVIADLIVNFKDEVFYGDILLIESNVDDLDEKSFRIYHRISREGHVVALAETGMMTYNYHIRKVVPIPNEFIKALKTYVAEGHRF